MARLLCHSTLKPMLSASPSVKMNSSKERVRLSSLPLVYNWDMTDPIHSNIKFLRGSVHLSISSIILGYFQSSLEHTTFNGEKAIRTVDWGLPECFHFLILGSDFYEIFFLLGIVSVHSIRIPPPPSALDSVSSSETTSCTKAPYAKGVAFSFI